MIETLENDRVDSKEIERLLGAAAELPASSELRAIVTRMLTALSSGVPVGVFEQDKELTPNEVATLINVSRPHVMKLIRLDLLAAHQNGAHWKVKYSDLVNYIERRDAASKDVADSVERVRRSPAFTLTDDEQALLDDM